MNPSASKRRNRAASWWVSPTVQSSSSRSSTCATVSCAPGACVASSSATSSKFIWALLRGNDLPGRRTFDAGDIRLGHRGSWQPALERHAECLQGLGHPGRAHHVDANTTGGFERGRSGKALEPRIHEADRCASARRLLGQHAARNRDRAAIHDRAESISDEVDLAHEFVVDAEMEISIRKLVERLEAGLTGRADHGADLADLGVQASDRCRVRDVHAPGRLLATREQDLVSTAQRRGDGLTDGASSTDEEDAHVRNLSRLSFPLDVNAIGKWKKPHEVDDADPAQARSIGWCPTALRGALSRSCCSTSRKYCRLASVSEHTSDQTRHRAPGLHHPP